MFYETKGSLLGWLEMLVWGRSSLQIVVY